MSPIKDLSPADNELKALLAEAQEKQKGVSLYVGGTTIGLAVLEVRDGVVIGKSREHSRIVVRLDRVDGAAMS